MTETAKYITKVEIQGFFGRCDIDWNLHPDVNVLAGGNGSGKTTILNAIYEITFNRGLNSPKLSIDLMEKILVSFHNGVKNERPLSYSEIKSIIYQDIIIDFIKTFDNKLDWYDSSTKQRNDNRIKTELDCILFELQIKYIKYQLSLSKKREAVDISNPDYFKEIEKIRYTYTQFLTIIDELFLESYKRLNLAKDEIEFLLDDKEINAYQLSSGEKQLLVILLTVLVQDNKPSILLMDEPETSLHIEWQRKLIKYIRELNPNVQIIIATHSPDIIIKGWLDKVVNIEDIIVKDNAVA
jgi:predicted ATP-dependent endonuclease of OLD family